VFVPEEPPLLAVLGGPHGVGPHVGSALALGQEHPALEGLGRVEAAQAPEQVTGHGRRCVALDDVGRPRGHAQSAVDGRLRLADQIRQRGAHHGRDGPAGVGLEADETVADQVLFVLGPGGVVDDLVDVVSPTVVAPQDRTVAVGLLRPGGDDLAHEGAEPAQMLLGEGPVGRVGEVAVEQEGEVGIHPVPIEADGLLELGVVGKHGSMLRPGRRHRPQWHIG